MDSSGGTRGDFGPRLTAAALFACAALIVSFALLQGVPFLSSRDLAVLAGPLVFLCACVLVFWRPRFGYALGLFAGLIAVTWLIWTELSFYESSWIFLNLEATGSDRKLVLYAELRILSVLSVVLAMTCAALRLLPSRWSLRDSPFCWRTWPAFGVGFLVLAAWWAHSAIPYRFPLIVDSGGANLRILHVEKDGFYFHETLITARRDGRFYVGRDDRRLFQYRFYTWAVLGVMPQTACYRTMAFVESPELSNLRTAPAVALKSWNAEGWYVVLQDRRLLAFTTENKTTPPHEVTDLFHEIRKLPGTADEPGTFRDVSLGFGYGPEAALGFWLSR